MLIFSLRQARARAGTLVMEARLFREDLSLPGANRHCDRPDCTGTLQAKNAGLSQMFGGGDMGVYRPGVVSKRRCSTQPLSWASRSCCWPSLPSCHGLKLGRYLRWQAVIALLGIVLLAALCAMPPTTSPRSPSPTGAAYVEGVAGDPEYLNPLLSQYNQVDALLVSLLFNGLTRLDEQGNVVPDLAEAWTVSQDGLTYDFRLATAFYWHDGAPVTAADVSTPSARCRPTISPACPGCASSGGR